ncbi:hypothetical protein K440DRAFT_646013 [Wilcoxina mikolae CBS 423.85]|nr:hypothetical protein K440DRAFT_646013 [Wilcoxina mikolae CBS 423.85]
MGRKEEHPIYIIGMNIGTPDVPIGMKIGTSGVGWLARVRGSKEDSKEYLSEDSKNASREDSKVESNVKKKRWGSGKERMKKWGVELVVKFKRKDEEVGTVEFLNLKVMLKAPQPKDFDLIPLLDLKARRRRERRRSWMKEELVRGDGGGSCEMEKSRGGKTSSRDAGGRATSGQGNTTQSTSAQPAGLDRLRHQKKHQNLGFPCEMCSRHESTFVRTE